MAEPTQPADVPSHSAQRFSLERLSSAFARLMGSPAQGAGAKKPQIAVDPTASDDLEVEDQPLPISPRMIVEGLLFVGRDDGRPMTAHELAGPIRNVEADEIPGIVVELNAGYRQDGAPYEIVADGSAYRLALRPESASVREKMRGQLRTARLTPSALEVLSVVAYRQPVTSDEVNRARGTRSQAILAQLVRRQLLRVDRSGEGRPTPRYLTTDRFNKLFGISGPGELPGSEELADS